MPLTASYLSLADLTVLGPRQENPFRAQSMAYAHDVCARYGLALPAMEHYTSMSSFLFPRTSLERLMACDLLNAVLFYIDDVYDRHAPSPLPGHDQLTAVAYADCVAIFETGQLPERAHRLYPICQELHRRFAALTSPTYLRRMAAALGSHLQGTVDTFVAAGGPAAQIAAYTALRVHDAGMYPTVLLIECASGLELAEAVQRHPVIQEAVELVSVIAALMNDLFSYEKEVLRFGSRFNLVQVMMDAYHLDFAAAVDESVRHINQLIATFARVETRLPTWPSAALNQQAQAYMQGLRDQLIAAWHWQLSTNRYRSPHSPFALLRSWIAEDDAVCA